MLDTHQSSPIVYFILKNVIAECIMTSFIFHSFYDVTMPRLLFLWRHAYHTHAAHIWWHLNTTWHITSIHLLIYSYSFLFTRSKWSYADSDSWLCQSQSPRHYNRWAPGLAAIARMSLFTCLLCAYLPRVRLMNAYLWSFF